MPTSLVGWRTFRITASAQFNYIAQVITYYEKSKNRFRLSQGHQMLTEKGRRLHEAVTMRQICAVYELEDLYAATKQKHRDLSAR